MNKIGSEFLKEIDDYEAVFWWKFTQRQTILLVGIVLVGFLGTVIFLYRLPELFIYLLALVVLPPFVLYGLKKETKVIDRVRYLITIQERVYQTEFRKEKDYIKHDFLAPKGVRETDRFGAAASRSVEKAAQTHNAEHHPLYQPL